MRKIKPDIVFSKGGFVSVPVVLAAGHKRIPVIIHESDMTPGLANKIAMRSATKICCNFPETVQYLPQQKAVLTGSPIRKELLQGNKLAGLNLCHFNTENRLFLLSAEARRRKGQQCRACHFTGAVKGFPGGSSVRQGQN